MVAYVGASIGQVYKVRLRANNAICALKVQRPDALESASLDMYLLRKLAAFAKKKYKLQSDLVGVADVIRYLKSFHNVMISVRMYFIGVRVSAVQRA
jgi:predicted unusual protein kinase regulating ubiquinone biosynthesis (AarF/ABC1/UbiB family)